MRSASLHCVQHLAYDFIAVFLAAPKDTHSRLCFASRASRFISDAKDFIPVLTADGKETGLIKIPIVKQTAGGLKIDTGANAAEGAAAEEGEEQETKWDHFWSFPSIEVRNATLFSSRSRTCGPCYERTFPTQARPHCLFLLSAARARAE